MISASSDLFSIATLICALLSISPRVCCSDWQRWRQGQGLARQQQICFGNGTADIAILVCLAKACGCHKTLAHRTLAVYTHVHLLHHNIHQPALDHQHLHHFLAFDGGFDLFVGEGQGAHGFFVGVGGDGDARLDLAVDLDRDLDLFFFRQLGIVLRPGRAQQLAGSGRASPTARARDTARRERASARGRAARRPSFAAWLQGSPFWTASS